MNAPPASVVIVGGGLAGYTLADALRRRDYAGTITIIDREPELYDRPPLSKAAFVGDSQLADLAFASQEALAARGIEARTGRTVTELVPGGVITDDGQRSNGDAIVLATGGSARRLSFPGDDAPIVHTLRTFADAQRIRAGLRPGARALVVGAGLIGAELTASMRALDVEVTLIDPVEIPLAAAAGEHVARRLHAMHADRGVDTRITTLAELMPDGSAWVAVLADGSRLPIDLVVVGAGLIPDTRLAEAAGLEVDDGIVVDERHEARHGVYAIGDVARTRAADGTLSRRAEHWEAAQLDALELAEVLVGGTPAPRGASWWWSDRYDAHVEGVGRMTGPGETLLRGDHAALHLDDGHLVGAVSIDDANLVRAARRIIDQRVPVSAAELTDPTIPLRRLLAAART